MTTTNDFLADFDSDELRSILRSNYKYRKNKDEWSRKIVSELLMRDLMGLTQVIAIGSIMLGFASSFRKMKLKGVRDK
jgi:hypothetical protein